MAHHLDPVRRVGLNPVTEPLVLTPRTGQDRYEAATVTGDVGQCRMRTELGVGHIEKVGTPDQRPKGVPGFDVRAVVGDIAIAGAVVHGHRPIGAHGQDPQQLFEIGAMVLVVAMRDTQGRLAALLVPVGAGVLS